MEGWIKLHRKSFDNFLYRENRPLTRREAWEDILLRVNYIEGESLFGNEKILCKRGQSTMSLDSWGKIFNWDKSKVKRFFDLLQNNSMIVIENLHKTTRITVCKYEDYQGDRNANETQTKRKRNVDETRMKPIKEGKERKEIYIPEYLEFKEHAISQKSNLDLEHLKLKYDAWISNGWKNGNNKSIVNWKSALNNTIPYLKVIDISKVKSLLGY